MPPEQKTRSPIRDLPVRQAGQSLRNRILDVILDRFLLYFIIALVLTIAALEAWLQFFVPGETVPLTLSVLAVVAILLTITKGRGAFREANTLRLGKIGEEAVGQFLEEKLRPLGYQVLHDIPGDKFNLDHVVIGATGVYCIETKTHSKPARGKCTVVYDGEKVIVNGFKPDRDPIAQVKAGSSWLATLIEKTTGKKISVQPVVLYPGWFVESSAKWPEVWVINEKAAISWIQRAHGALDDPDVHLLTYHLKRYVIAKTKEEAP